MAGGLGLGVLGSADMVPATAEDLAEEAEAGPDTTVVPATASDGEEDAAAAAEAAAARQRSAPARGYVAKRCDRIRTGKYQRCACACTNSYKAFLCLRRCCRAAGKRGALAPVEQPQPQQQPPQQQPEAAAEVARLRRLYDDVDAEEMAAEGEEEGQQERGAAGRRARSPMGVEGDLLLGENDGWWAEWAATRGVWVLLHTTVWL